METTNNGSAKLESEVKEGSVPCSSAATQTSLEGTTEEELVAKGSDSNQATRNPNKTKKRRTKNYDSLSPRRKSKRDTNSIRLNGVGKTALTFYSRMCTLFFSNSKVEDYHTWFSNGAKRGRSKIRSDGNPNRDDSIHIQRVTNPDEAPIYVIDNFLSEKELEYFDEKIEEIPFQRSFVDNMGYDDATDDNDNDDDDNIDDAKETSIQKHDRTDLQNKMDSSTCGRASTGAVLDQGKREAAAHLEADQQIVTEGTRIDVPSEEQDGIQGTPCNGNSINNNGKPVEKKKRNRKRKRKTLIDDSHRTSTFYSFRKLHDSKISALERRIANILGCWVHQIEALQLVRYVPGQFFGIHHDLGNLLEDDTVELPRKDWCCKRRIVTMFCYLNTLQDDEGGCTYFPKCGHLRVKPRRGRAVLWCNITKDGRADPKTIHAGEPVRSKKLKPTELTTDAFTVNKQTRNTNCDDAFSDDQPERKRDEETTKYGLNIWVCEE